MSLVLTSGTILDEKYEILELVGRGGIGAVYKAQQLEVGRMVAVKFLQFDLADEESRERFRREAMVMSSLSHRNLPVFYSFGLWQQSIPFIVMEFLSGRTLRAVLADSVLDWGNATRLILQVCEGVGYAHSAGVIHRDLKPDNIFILDSAEHGYSTSNRELVKICDFGLAKILQPEGTESKLKTLTETGFLIGTADYMSPEQCLGRKADQRSDIYSIACILFQAITGSAPFTADSPIGVIHKHVNDPPPQITQSDIPPALNAIMQKALAKDPDERYQSTTEFSHDLSCVLQGSALQYAKPAVVNKNKKWLLAGTAAGVIIVAGASTAIFLKSTEIPKSTIANDIESDWSSSKKQLAAARSQFYQGHGDIALRILDKVLDGRKNKQSRKEKLLTAKIYYTCVEYMFRASIDPPKMRKYLDLSEKLIEDDSSSDATELRALLFAFQAHLPGTPADQTETFLKNSLDAKQKLPKETNANRAQLALLLGRAKFNQGKFEDEEAFLKESLAMQDSVVAAGKPASQSVLFDQPYDEILASLGRSYVRQEKYEALVADFLPRIDHLLSGKKRYEFNEAVVDQLLANALKNLKRNAEAQKYFSRSLQIYDSDTRLEIEKFVFDSAENLVNLGEPDKAQKIVLQNLGRVELSTEYLERYLKRMIEFARFLHNEGNDKLAASIAKAALKSSTLIEDNLELQKTCLQLLGELSRK